ncbi:PilN domain-containing protein [Luteitalea sp.]
MIRVNLLAAEPVRAKAPLFSGVGANKLHIIGVAMVAGCIGLAAYRHLDLQSQQTYAELQLQQAKAEETRLKAVTEELARFEAQTALLQQRVALIEQLRKGQRSPVTLLDQVSRQLPERLWLTQLTQAGADVTLEGRTTTLTALSDLIGNLENSGAFTRPVEIVNTEVENGRDEADLMKFTVRALFPLGALDTPADTKPARPGAPAARR